ncbi:biotin transporter BioY [Terrilactibacillus laevilacticus]|uniref:Biotin transporter n=1 Tax=Terrilactibacillus laevilacticus TaxID=1380157 RepID=A0ABW5PPF3_9BACI|nr:biotin transporter BioY [Terrilactibacillus laevilacticus]
MKTKTLVLISLFVAFMAVLGFMPGIPVPVISVSITLQTLGVMLIGGVLGAKKGFTTLFVFTLLVAIGAPFLAGGRGGLSSLVGPSGGYILSWPVAAFVIGLLSNFVKPGRYQVVKYFGINVLGGIILVYAAGIMYYSMITSSPIIPVTAANLAFIPGDVIKAIVSAVLTVQLRKRLKLSNNTKMAA